jgi:hypothetical protein
MRSLIHVERRPGREDAQPSITPSMSVSMRTTYGATRSVRARRRGTCTASSGRMPRCCGSIQYSAGSSALSAMGKMPHV